jgi:hypothetical protein
MSSDAHPAFGGRRSRPPPSEAPKLAGAGRRDEAARHFQSIDQRGNIRLADLSLVKAGQACVMMGDFDRAVGYIGRALGDSLSFFLHAGDIPLDPIWDPLRKRADFKKLVEAQ